MHLALQNDCQCLSFVKDVHAVCKKMARTCQKRPKSKVVFFEQTQTICKKWVLVEFFKLNRHMHMFIRKTRVVPLQLGRILKLLPRSRNGTFNLIGIASAKFPIMALESIRLVQNTLSICLFHGLRMPNEDLNQTNLKWLGQTWQTFVLRPKIWVWGVILSRALSANQCRHGR